MLTISRIRILYLSLCSCVSIPASSPSLEWRTQKSIYGIAHQRGHGSETKNEGETPLSRITPDVRLHQHAGTELSRSKKTMAHELTSNRQPSVLCTSGCLFRNLASTCDRPLSPNEASCGFNCLPDRDPLA